jgi:hypothetical protein
MGISARRNASQRPVWRSRTSHPATEGSQENGEELAINARRIDPRDQSWEIDRPSYRVYFWHRQGTVEDSISVSDEWELAGADDVAAVMSWAESNSRGRQFVIYVIALTQEGVGLVRLFGLGPSARPG